MRLSVRVIDTVVSPALSSVPLQQPELRSRRTSVVKIDVGETTCAYGDVAACFPVQRTIGQVDKKGYAALVQRDQSALVENGSPRPVFQVPEIIVLEIVVADSGCGLTQIDAERLFEAFQQVRYLVVRS